MAREPHASDDSTRRNRHQADPQAAEPLVSLAADDSINDEHYERLAFRIVALTSLPGTGVDLIGWPGAEVDWKAVASVAVDIMKAQADPLDYSEIARRVQASKVRKSDREWAIQLFTNAIGIHAGSRRWVDGRHRVEAMRQAGVTRSVLKVFP